MDDTHILKICRWKGGFQNVSFQMGIWKCVCEKVSLEMCPSKCIFQCVSIFLQKHSQMCLSECVCEKVSLEMSTKISIWRWVLKISLKIHVSIKMCLLMCIYISLNISKCAFKNVYIKMYLWMCIYISSETFPNVLFKMCRWKYVFKMCLLKFLFEDESLKMSEDAYVFENVSINAYLWMLTYISSKTFSNVPFKKCLWKCVCEKVSVEMCLLKFFFEDGFLKMSLKMHVSLKMCSSKCIFECVSIFLQKHFQMCLSKCVLRNMYVKRFLWKCVIENMSLKCVY